MVAYDLLARCHEALGDVAQAQKVLEDAGIDEERKLSEESMQRGLDCLKRFAQLINGMPLGAVRIVGTNALRAIRCSSSRTFPGQS